MPHKCIAEQTINTTEELHTPTTPTDTGNVSEEEEFVNMHFECIVVWPSGTTLGQFKCDETTTVGWIRSQVRKVLEEVRRPNTYVRTTQGFALVRGENILRNDSNRIYEQREPGEVDCILSIIGSSQTPGTQAARLKRPRRNGGI